MPEDHVHPHRAWTHLHENSDLTMAEHSHILRCEQCLRLFLLCLNSHSFGVVLKELEGASDQPSPA